MMIAAKKTRLPWMVPIAGLLLLPVGGYLALPADWPDWIRMWLVCGMLMTGCKAISWYAVSYGHASRPARHAARIPGASNKAREWAYWFAWPGLDALAFLRSGSFGNGAVAPVAAREWLFGLLNTAVGAVALGIAAGPLAGGSTFVRAWVAMAGIVLLLHHGVFKLLSCAWRSFGVDAAPLMRAPLLAENLTDFWGRRWNVAFRDFAYAFVYRPVAQSQGPVAATWMVFLFSGLIHDIAISLPARGGYGWPTIYFLLQAAAIMVARSRVGKRLGLGGGVMGRIWTAIVLILPAPILFHEPFRVRVIVPMLDALGGLR